MEDPLTHPASSGRDVYFKNRMIFRISNYGVVTAEKGLKHIFYSTMCAVDCRPTPGATPKICFRCIFSPFIFESAWARRRVSLIQLKWFIALWKWPDLRRDKGSWKGERKEMFWSLGWHLIHEHDDRQSNYLLAAFWINSNHPWGWDDMVLKAH